MEYTVCGVIQGRVYATVTADSFEEAIAIAKKDACLDWDDEEWVQSPVPVSITDGNNNMRDI